MLLYTLFTPKGLLTIDALSFLDNLRHIINQPSYISTLCFERRKAMLLKQMFLGACLKAKQTL